MTILALAQVGGLAGVLVVRVTVQGAQRVPARVGGLAVVKKARPAPAS
ncbi:hypothetical protein [Pseudonocardia sp. TRM90224]|nr:hypothetical protein [Pseudonocardia sp. TRM90224]